MSKKKGKAAPKKAPMKKAAKTSAAKSRRPGRLASDNGRTVQATIFIFRTGQGHRIRTSPQRLYANPGDRIEWTVVNMVDGSDLPVTITWPNGGPWGKEAIEFRGSDRQPVPGGSGRFKYVVRALDAQEDPEIEIPDGN
jgi:hypothetical protein